MKIFHGACHGCVQQNKHGVAYCAGCQNFDANWSKPNLYENEKGNGKFDDKDWYKWRVKFVSKILHFLFGI